MTQYAYPDSDVDVGEWYDPMFAQDDLWDMINETQPLDSGSDWEYVYSADSYGADDSMTVGLSNVTDPWTKKNHVVRYRAKGDDQGSPPIPDLTVALLENSTQRATVTITPTSSYADYALILTESEANAISNYDNLRLKFTRVAAAGFGEEVYISQAYFECPTFAPAAGIAGIAYSPARSVASSASFGPTQRTR